MAKKFDIPEFYRSPVIRQIKDAQQEKDPRRKDLSPTVLDFGPLRLMIPRYFGFCFGVQNAIEIAYDAIAKNPGKRIFLLSEMIHNPNVNADLVRRGVQFLHDTSGKELIPYSELTPADIVIVPAFGTTIEIQKKLESIGINPYSWDTTCPFVEKVWKRGAQLGDKDFTLVIHGKYKHEETRATFSHAAAHGHAVVVLNVDEARILADLMLGKRPVSDFETFFGMKSTAGFNPIDDLRKFGVINQTTMLATETKEVMEVLKEAAIEKYGAENLEQHMADTRDTLCYATYENQSATQALLEQKPDLALVVGGFNSSNTLHLVEMLEAVCPTFHIRDVADIHSEAHIHHFNQWTKAEMDSSGWIPAKRPLTVAVNAGASCPDILVDEVIFKLLEYFSSEKTLEEALASVVK